MLGTISVSSGLCTTQFLGLLICFKCSLTVSAMLQMSLQIQGFYNALDTTPVKFWAIGSASDVNAVQRLVLSLSSFWAY